MEKTALATRAEPEEKARTGGRAHVVLPAFNEEAALPALLRRLADVALTEQLTVWVVDDGSSDRSAAVAGSGFGGLEVRVVRHAVNLGLGRAVQSGLRAALEKAGSDDVIVVMDADDTHDPGLITLLRAEIATGSDVAICSRFVPGGDDRTAPLVRRMLSRGAAQLFRRALGVEGVRDFTSGYRAYRATLLARASEHWGERLIEEQGFACMVELLLKLRHCHPVITEIPLDLRYDRKQGPSKLKLRRTLLQYLKLLARDRLSPAPYRKL
ncbi:dolichol-phosphate mannosyltransferase [Amycolatopsis regifaucium]|uniref:Dolichol-phosphate mannosyltransferase n=1 Tax=Amycolatopsis regifaucium TaxID=546365 RepID=A0A154M9Q2_9PSEU|nr:dolichol-phosphate mannosyltransferase [Amycolatopsis regifaucium]OKA04771.1 dolichol-phosphate mannosyltransferase [Amycolatopsis regifaucium]